MMDRRWRRWRRRRRRRLEVKVEVEVVEVELEVLVVRSFYSHNFLSSLHLPVEGGPDYQHH